MQIDLKELYSKEILTIAGIVNINKEYYLNTDIVDLKDITINGKVYLETDKEIRLEGLVEGIMVLNDAYTLELVDYPFNFEMEENLKIAKNDENILDITEILWQNIVLEVPISFSKSEKLSLKGDGWELNSEENKKIDSRLAKLTELLKEGKE